MGLGTWPYLFSTQRQTISLSLSQTKNKFEIGKIQLNSNKPLYLYLTHLRKKMTEEQYYMENSSKSKLILLLSFLTIIFLPSHSKTVTVDGVSQWRNPTIHVGDSVIFKHKHQYYNLYIFQNRRAFNICNFTQAFLLTKPNSTSFTWHASRPGFFYFSFNTCQESEKLAVRVIPKNPENWGISPELPPAAAPSPAFGGALSSSPAYTWPFFSHGASSPATAPPIVPDKGGGMPFINSNPAVPLPTGEADSATIRPLPTSDHEKKVVELLTIFQIPLYCMVWLIF